MEQANRQPKQDGTAHTKRTAGSGSAGQTNRRKSLRKGGRKAARRPGTKRRNTAEKGEIPPWASREKAAKKPVPSAQSRQAGQTVPKNSPRTRSACRKNAGAPGAEKPLRTGKTRVRSFACPEGPCEPGPPKNRFAVFGWHGFWLRIAHNAARSAEQRGRRPLLSPAAF